MVKSEKTRKVVIGLMIIGMALVGAPPEKASPKKESQTPLARAEAGTPADEAEKLEHVKYPYKPNLIRDPFASPSDNVDKSRLDSIDDISIMGQGRFQGVTYLVALDSKAKQKNYPVGFRFKDGEIISISKNSVTFRQWDPTAINRTGKIVEKLFKRKEGKQ